MQAFRGLTLQLRPEEKKKKKRKKGDHGLQQKSWNLGS
jgi:hypothetical protein